MQSVKGQNEAHLISCNIATKLWEARSQHGPLLWGKNILQWTFLDVTKAKFFGLETYYYIKPICKLEIPTK
jgi:hypothetical protein